ncbi:MAG TPA: DUF2318 domain-containing protein [Desulfuromonadales bacterium]|nr:DUF2318 domain-containing protein [Desulfuromonadales bacterium]
MSDRQEKKEQFEKSEKKSPLVWFVVALVAVIAAGGGWLTLGGSDSAFARVDAKEGKVRIPVSQVDDGKAHFFTFRDGDADINFFLVESGDGVIRAAFDTCDVCYKEKKGYRQEGNLMICNNCEQSFPTERINVVKGGCNPAPLVRMVGSDQVLIAAADLKKGAWYFRGE